MTSDNLFTRLPQNTSRVMLDKMSYFVGLLSPCGGVLDLNVAAQELMGLTHDEALGKKLWELPLCPPERSALLRRDFFSVVKQQRNSNYEVALTRGDETPIFVDFCLRPLTDTQGRVNVVLAEGYEITGRKHLENELLEAQSRLHEAQAVARIGSWELELASSQVTWSPETFRLFHFDPSQGEPDYETHLSRHHPDDQPLVTAAIQDAIHHGIAYDLQLRIVLPSGELRWLQCLGRAVYGSTGELLKLVGTSQDITDWKRAELERERRERALTEVLDVMPHLAILVDPRGRVTYYNGHFYDFTGVARQRSILGVNWRLCLANDDLKLVINEVRSLPTRREPFEFEVRIRRHDGMLRWHLMRVVPIFGGGQEVERFIVTGTDISERRHQEEVLHRANTRLEVLANTDALTRVSNRHALDERLALEWEKAKREGSPLSAVLLDVDYFKSFNDTYGHICGDVILQQLGQLLLTNTRSSDLAARYGGEEFMILLPNTDAPAAARWAERLRSSIESRSWPNRAITASFGVTTWNAGILAVNQEVLTPAGLVNAADEALYRAKARRNCVCTSFYGETLESTTTSILGSSESATEQ
ncbi:MAG: diguanylate cyclase [Armatimonadetes bacterium]|nr:diguanylate cyclase [Armatimonadota bacterium]